MPPNGQVKGVSGVLTRGLGTSSRYRGSSLDVAAVHCGDGGHNSEELGQQAAFPRTVCDFVNCFSK